MTDQWDLTRIYKTQEEFEEDLKKMKEEVIPA